MKPLFNNVDFVADLDLHSSCKQIGLADIRFGFAKTNEMYLPCIAISYDLQSSRRTEMPKQKCIQARSQPDSHFVCPVPLFSEYERNWMKKSATWLTGSYASGIYKVFKHNEVTCSCCCSLLQKNTSLSRNY